MTEFLVCYQAFEKTDPEAFAISMPNKWNFSVYPRWVLVLFPIFSSTVLAPQMYSYLLGQRRKYFKA